MLKHSVSSNVSVLIHFCIFSLQTHTSVQVLQEFHQQLFVQKNLMFQQAADFLFQPIDSDTVNPDALITKSIKRQTWTAQHSDGVSAQEQLSVSCRSVAVCMRVCVRPLIISLIFLESLAAQLMNI